MAYYYNDLTGQRFGRLTVEKVVGRKYRKLLWRCLCDCGKYTVVVGSSLTTGNTRSCGCDRFGHNKKYGKTASHSQRLYNIWCGIKNRCLNPHCDDYQYYGGKGVTICEEWKNNYMAFRAWAISHGYKEDLTIDRISPDGNYSPFNCRWTDYKTQANNRTNNVRLTFQGRTKTISEWAREIGISDGTIRSRIRRGCSSDEALMRPVRRMKWRKK